MFFYTHVNTGMVKDAAEKRKQINQKISLHLSPTTVTICPRTNKLGENTKTKSSFRDNTSRSTNPGSSSRVDRDRFKR